MLVSEQLLLTQGYLSNLWKLELEKANFKDLVDDLPAILNSFSISKVQCTSHKNAQNTREQAMFIDPFLEGFFTSFGKRITPLYLAFGVNGRRDVGDDIVHPLSGTISGHEKICGRLQDVQRILQDEDEEKTEMHTTFMRVSCCEGLLSVPCLPFRYPYPERVIRVVSLGLPFMRTADAQIFPRELFREGFCIFRFVEPGRAEADFGHLDVQSLETSIFFSQKAKFQQLEKIKR
ncbi:hypothetical protein GIB67_021279 [Kingdonia uniflora]|uniref:Uncharacterized protein n=1 Tax=Kingdonia uniflora TaxID=39325 RepID=A0A7J7LFR0_9MAGN|nr:hypothetical protein GIB67_021279 [Kingdonia uniflora]